MAESNNIIALFPGAFKPPHQAHLAAVKYLLARDEIELIVIIIANRSRRLPNSLLGIDANGAMTLFRSLLTLSGVSTNRVKFEIAQHRAIDHAVNYISKVTRGTSLLYCLGEADAMAGDKRFNRIIEISQQYGVDSRVEIVPKASNPVRATTLRGALAKGDVAEFNRGLPEDFSPYQKSKLWTLARSSLSPIAEIRCQKVLPIIRAAIGAEPQKLICVDKNAFNPEYSYRDGQDQYYLVKYAGDETDFSGSSLGNNTDRPQRIGIERRTIKRLRLYVSDSFLLPELVYFDREHRLLILKQDRGTTLKASLDKGVFSPTVAALLGKLLREFHCFPRLQEPLWPTFECEIAYVEQQVSDLIEISSTDLSVESKLIINARLAHVVRGRRHHVFSIMDFSSDNIVELDNSKKLTIKRFDRSLTLGDAALDMASIIAPYVVAGLKNRKIFDASQAIDALLVSYISTVDARLHCDAGQITIYLALWLYRLHEVDIPSRRRLANALIQKVSQGCKISDLSKVLFREMHSCLVAS